MKDNDPYNVGKLKIRYSDAQINEIRPIAWETKTISINIPQKYKGRFAAGFVQHI